MTHRTIKGTHDILPEDSVRWQELERVIYDVAAATEKTLFLLWILHFKHGIYN